MRKLFIGLVAALLSLPVLAAPLSALAADPFTVAKVRVDATSDTAIAAQTRAIANGQIEAARILLNRLTLEGERAERGLPPLTSDVVGPMIRGLSIDNERRSATRYLGDVSVAFNPSAVQQLLRDQGLTMVRSQARSRLLVPVGFDPESDAALDAVSGRYAHALTPVLSPTLEELERLTTAPDALQIEALAAQYGVEQVLVVRPSASGIGAVDRSLDTGETRSLSARSLAALVARMEADWKATSAVPSASARTSTVSVLYGSQAEWQRLQRAINNSAQVRDARLDALSKDGALMTIRYGDLDRLAAEMSQKGVRVYEDPRLGLVISR
ncbi:MAG: hypothetical protein AAF311_03720 [Pseudomonadota bacterium]